MRGRKGNYMILFASLLPILLGFMALAIDIGRMRVARQQATVAADAAALAALAELRAGGSRSAAEAVAGAAANANRIQRVVDPQAGPHFDVAVDYGDWDFDGQSWSDRPDAIAGVTVNVAQINPLGLLFAPIFNVAAPFAGGSADGRFKEIAVGRRASMRPRDVVIVVDVSAPMREHLDDVRDGLDGVMDILADFDNPGDRVATVVFAGDSAVIRDFERVTDEGATIRGDLADLEMCEVTIDAWQRFYRFFDTVYDLELEPYGMDPDAVFNYAAIYENPSFAGAPTFNDFSEDPSREGPWAQGSIAADSFLSVGPGQTWFEADYSDWMRALDEEEQCGAWWWSGLNFLMFDPRRTDSMNNVLDFAPVSCHAGNYWEDEPDRYEFLFPLPELDDCDASMALSATLDPFNDPDDGDSDFDYPDRSFVQAGTNPGRGMQAAADLLAAAQPSRGEATVIVITAAGPRCGPLLDGVDAFDCVDLFELELSNAVIDLAGLRANTHILAVGDVPLAEQDVLFDGLTGRGLMRTAENATEINESLAEIARSVRLQVVE